MAWGGAGSTREARKASDGGGWPDCGNCERQRSGCCDREREGLSTFSRFVGRELAFVSVGAADPPPVVVPVCASSLFDTEPNLHAFPAYRRRGHRSANVVQACTASLHCCCPFQGSRRFVAENVALRHQLSCLIHRRPRPKLRPVDRVFLGAAVTLLEWLEGKPGW